MATIHDVAPNVSFSAYIELGKEMHPIESMESVDLNHLQSRHFIDYLKGSPWGDRLATEFDLARVFLKSDGTGLLSAVIPIERCVAMLRGAGAGYQSLYSKVCEWRVMTHCNAVIVDFVDNREAEAQDGECA